MKPLAGRRVLDLSKVIAGPLCTQYLADLGAEVIKIETLDGGDDSRQWPPLCDDTGATFLSLNRGKKSVAVDLKSEAGHRIVVDLARTSDVLVESFAPDIKTRLGLSAPILREENPGLIYCSISGFGQTGPLRSALGYDAVLQAFTGLMGLNGEPGAAPVRLPASPIDQMTGLNAAVGILAALLNRTVDCQGVDLEVSLFETATAMLAPTLQGFWENGVTPPRAGSAHPSICPYQVFETADKPVLIAIANERLWRRFCEATGREDLLADPRFRTNPDRVAHFAQTVAVVQDLVRARPSAHWVDLLTSVDVPCAPVNMLADLAAHPHTAARGIVVDYEDAQRGASHAIGLPIMFDGTARTAGSPPPRLGQHTREVLASLGLDNARIAELEAEGCVRSAR